MSEKDCLTNVLNEDKSDTIMESETVECDESNGLILSDHYIPYEVLLQILSSIDRDSLRENCTLVCKKWNSLITEYVWKIKAERKFRKKFPLLKSRAFYFLCFNDNFDKNLVPNPSGENGFKGWSLFHNSGDRWIVEDIPQGCEPLPESEFGDKTKCFATSYYECAKLLEVDLSKHGFSYEIMELKPHIYISEWYAARNDCGCEYNLNVTFSDSGKCILKEFDFRFIEDQFQGGKWHKIEHVFKNYVSFGRYITLYHSGKDRQFWAGHYGPKMAGTTVKVLSDTLGQDMEVDKDDYCLLQKAGDAPAANRRRSSYEELHPTNWFLKSDNEDEEYEIGDNVYSDETFEVECEGMPDRNVDSEENEEIRHSDSYDAEKPSSSQKKEKKFEDSVESFEIECENMLDRNITDLNEDKSDHENGNSRCKEDGNIANDDDISVPKESGISKPK